jgi:osmoprotectant transport system permease protein
MRRAVGLLLVLPLWAAPSAARPVVIGSKNFEESRLLGEMFAQLLEARGHLPVERRLGLAGTQVCFEALRTGAIDVYPEYTGTGLVSILGEPAAAGARATLTRVRAVFLDRWDAWWLAPLGFENAYQLATPRTLAERLKLATVTDLARVAPQLRAAFGHEFLARPDGLPGLARVYGMRFARVESMQETLKYQAVRDGRVDVIDVYTTDGRLLSHDLRVLRDDRGFFPPYQAAPLVRGAALRAHPELGATLALLAGALDDEAMQRLNLRLQVARESEAQVAHDALASLGLLPAKGRPAGGTAGRPANAPGLWHFLWVDRGALAHRTLTHLTLSAIALALGILFAVPLGLLLERSRRSAEPIIGLLGLLQTIPSLALLAFMIPFLGVGAAPAIAALWVYSLFPIVRNTYTGVREADPRAVEGATALGMTPRQVLWLVRLPLAAPFLMAGIRTAAVLTVGTATLAAFIGAGGLGEPIVTGLQLASTSMILSGAIPAAALALLVDFLLWTVERTLRPAGVEPSR